MYFKLIENMEGPYNPRDFVRQQQKKRATQTAEDVRMRAIRSHISIKRKLLHLTLEQDVTPHIKKIQDDIRAREEGT